MRGAARDGLWLLASVGPLLACRSQPTAPAPGASPAPPAPPELEFEGNQSLTRSELMQAIGEEFEYLARDGIDKGDVDDLAYGVELHYRSRGFPDAYVSYTFEPGDPPRAQLVVEEGARVEVREWSLEGNLAPGFSSAELEPLFFPDSGGLLRSPSRWFVRSELESARSGLESRYLAAGYLDVSLGELQVQFEGEDPPQARVSLRIDEGPQFRLQEVRVVDESNRAPLTDEALAELRATHTDRDGTPLPYTPRLAQAARAHLLEHLGSQGYPEAQALVEPQVDPETGVVTVVLRVTPGPRITIAAVEFEGNEKTLAAFLRNRVTLRAGDVYDLGAVRDSFRRLFATGLFRRVTLDLERLPGAEADSEQRVLVVRVVEFPSREVYLEPGWGSYEGPRVKVGAVDKNVLGTGRSLRTEATLSVRYQRLVLGVSDRALFQSDVTGSASAYFARREEPSFSFEELGSGVDFGWSWPNLHLNAVLGYGYRSTEVTDVEVQSAELNAFLAQIDISSITLTLGRDVRDHLFLPGSGNYTRASFEWSDDSLGSDVNFLAGSLEHSRFYPLPWEGGVLGVGVDTGVIAPTDGQGSLPLQVRLFNGGANTVRSYDQSELGPKDANGEALGGEAFSVFSVEARQEMFGNLSGALFYDAGNLAPSYRDYFEFNGMRQAIGVGVRYLLPIGPARLDFGVNPDPGPQDDDWTLHFAVGLAF